MSKFYSDLKIFRFASKLEDISKGILSAPLHVRLKPTNRCNHGCYYCCYRNKNLYLSQLFKENDEIPWEKMKEIINDLKLMGVKAVTLSGGGEPLLYPCIYETIDILAKSGIKVAVLTNGSLLKGKIAKILAEKATWIRISIDAADSKNYSEIRRVGSKEFGKVCENIYNFSKKRKRRCQLGINFIVMKENYRDVYKFLKIMKKIDVDHVKVSESVIDTKKEKNKKYYSHFIKSIKQQIEKGISNLSDDKFSIIDKFEDFGLESDCYNKKYTRCLFMQCLTVIGADMNVYTCQDKAYTKKGKLGSIKNRRFSQLWFSNSNKKKLSKLNPSKNCNHHCTQHKKNLMLFDSFELDKKHLEFV